VYTSLSERPAARHHVIRPRARGIPHLTACRGCSSSYSILVDSVWILHTSTHSFMLYSNIEMGPFGWYYAVTARPYKCQSMLGSLGRLSINAELSCPFAPIYSFPRRPWAPLYLIHQGPRGSISRNRNLTNVLSQDSRRYRCDLQ
jgi:hypothetical protein